MTRTVFTGRQIAAPDGRSRNRTLRPWTVRGNGREDVDIGIRRSRLNLFKGSRRIMRAEVRGQMPGK